MCKNAALGELIHWFSFPVYENQVLRLTYNGLLNNIYLYWNPWFATTTN